MPLRLKRKKERGKHSERQAERERLFLRFIPSTKDEFEQWRQVPCYLRIIFSVLCAVMSSVIQCCWCVLTASVASVWSSSGSIASLPHVLCAEWVHQWIILPVISLWRTCVRLLYRSATRPLQLELRSCAQCMTRSSHTTAWRINSLCVWSVKPQKYTRSTALNCWMKWQWTWRYGCGHWGLPLIFNLKYLHRLHQSHAWAADLFKLKDAYKHLLLFLVYKQFAVLLMITA